MRKLEYNIGFGKGLDQDYCEVCCDKEEHLPYNTSTERHPL